jgi:hypothetical protein
MTGSQTGSQIVQRLINARITELEAELTELRQWQTTPHAAANGMTPERRAEISRRMKEYWKAKKAAGKRGKR